MRSALGRLQIRRCQIKAAAGPGAGYPLTQGIRRNLLGKQSAADSLCRGIKNNTNPSCSVRCSRATSTVRAEGFAPSIPSLGRSVPCTPPLQGAFGGRWPRLYVPIPALKDGGRGTAGISNYYSGRPYGLSMNFCGNLACISPIGACGGAWDLIRYSGDHTVRMQS